MLRAPWFHRFVLLMIAISMSLLATQPAQAWQFTAAHGGSHNVALAVADDAKDHVVAVGHLGSQIFVVKLNRKDGQELWQFRLAASQFELGTSVAVDAVGHVIAAGTSGSRMAVIKLDGTSGIPHWTALIDDASALRVAVDASGDVITAGQIGDAMGIVKLRGADGLELWRARPHGPDTRGQARALAVDHFGDAVAAGTLQDARFANNFAVAKVDGSTGQLVWRYEIPAHEFGGDDEALDVATDQDGNAFVTGAVRPALFNNSLPRVLIVVKLARESGSVVWRHDVDQGESGNTASDEGRALAVDAAGNVVAVGSFQNFTLSAVVKLAGTDGAELWRHLSTEPGSTRVVDVDKAGHVYTSGDGVARKLSGPTGEQLWRTDLGARDVRAITADDTNGVTIAGAVEPDFAIVKLHAGDGSDFLME